MRNYLIFDGEDSRDYGVYITGSGVFNAPGWAIDEVAIPGRDGLFLMAGRRLENIEVTYPCFIYANYKEQISRFRNMLLSRNGNYVRIMDSYHPGEFRSGVYAGPFEVEPTLKLDAGSFDLTFNCMPQRYLLSGQETITLTASGEIENPTPFSAKPLIRAYGTGSLSAGGGSITVNAAPSAGYTDLDCNTMEAYIGGTSRNAYISLGNYSFPRLYSGTSRVNISGFSKVEITPRWWIV